MLKLCLVQRGDNAELFTIRRSLEGPSTGAIISRRYLQAVGASWSMVLDRNVFGGKLNIFVFKDGSVRIRPDFRFPCFVLVNLRILSRGDEIAIKPGDVVLIVHPAQDAIMLEFED